MPEFAGAANVESFDVFDTVLTRTIGTPRSLYLLVARELARLHSAISPSGFAHAREYHERRLMRLLGRQPTLDEIYAQLCAAWGLSETLVDLWVRAETDAERRVCVALPGADLRVNSVRDSGARIVFLSDTPHSAGFVTELLTASGLWRPGDMVVTSADEGVSKAGGGLFSRVAGRLPPARELRHVGDHPQADRVAPRLEGWRSAWCPEGRLNRYERTLELFSESTDGVSSLLAGAARLSRLEASAGGMVSARGQVGASVLGPTLVGFAWWVAGQARRSGIRRLYYVARDGHVMLEAARPLMALLAPELELRYIHGSRQPWILGAAAHSDAVLRAWAEPRPDFTPRTTLARLGLGPEQARSLVKHRLFQAEWADLTLTSRDRAVLHELLVSEPMYSVIRRNASACSSRTTSYLRQQGVLDGVPSAFVDAGWGGRTAGALDTLVRAEGAEPPMHLLMAVTGNAVDAERHRGSTVCSWLFDLQQWPRGAGEIPSPNVLVEMLCAGREGRTLDYHREEDDQWKPVFARPDNRPIIEWGLPAVQAVAVRTAERFAAMVPGGAAPVDWAPPVRAILQDFWTRPTREEAREWGSFPWEDEVASEFSTVATSVTVRSALIRLSRGDGVRPNNSWRAGSAQLSPRPWRWVLKARGWLQLNKLRVARLPRRIRLEVAARIGR